MEAFKQNADAARPAEAPLTPAEGIPDHLREFSSIFSKEAFDVLPDPKQWDHAIELVPGEKQSGCKVYPLSPFEQKELDAFLEENYRALNVIMVKNKYPLPLISELIEKLQGAKYFTKLDIRWGFNNVQMKEGDEWKAAFHTNRGLFEPLVMFFGLTNSLATFQTMMNDIFWELVAEGTVVVYIDDILIFTETVEQHREVTH